MLYLIHLVQIQLIQIRISELGYGGLGRLASQQDFIQFFISAALQLVKRRLREEETKVFVKNIS